MRRLLVLIFFLPALCPGQTIVQGASITANLKPHVIGTSGDTYILFQKEAIQFAIKEFNPEITGISEDFFISFVKTKPVFLFNETADMPFSLKKPAPPVVVNKDTARIVSKSTPLIALEDQHKPVEQASSEKGVIKKEPPKNQSDHHEDPDKKTSIGPESIGAQDRTGNQNNPVEKSNEVIGKSEREEATNINIGIAPDQSKTSPQSGFSRDEVIMPRYHALIIGVSNYKYAGADLGSLERPVLDATKLSETLIKYYRFGEEDVHLLKDATRAEIIDALEELGTRMTDRDNLIVFYAGHGYWDDNLGIGYWLPSDALLNKKSSWIANSTIKDYIGGIRTKHSLLISDACFSGSIFKVREVGTLTDLGVSNLYRLPSRKAMTSGSMRTVPDKSKFFEYLNKRLLENQDKYLSARQLFQNFYVAVINNTNTVPQYGVIQETGDEGGEFIFMRK